MPSIRDKHTIKAIAREYVSNGHKRAEALVAVGYQPAYANSGHCAKIYARKDIREAIEAYQADLRVDTSYTVHQAEAEYEEARKLALSLNQPSAAVSATTGKARLYGMDKDNDVSDDKTAEIEANQVEAAKELAKALVEQSVQKPKIKLA